MISSTKEAKTDANFNFRKKLLKKFPKILLLACRISYLKVIHSPEGPSQEYPRFTLPSVASATKSVPLPDWSNLQEHNWMVQWKRQPLESRYSQTWWTVPLSQSCTLSPLFSNYRLEMISFNCSALMRPLAWTNTSLDREWTMLVCVTFQVNVCYF